MSGVTIPFDRRLVDLVLTGEKLEEIKLKQRSISHSKLGHEAYFAAWGALAAEIGLPSDLRENDHVICSAIDQVIRLSHCYNGRLSLARRLGVPQLEVGMSVWQGKHEARIVSLNDDGRITVEFLDPPKGQKKCYATRADNFSAQPS